VGPSSLRVVVADDDASVRAVIRRALREEPDLELAGTARDGAEAWRTALDLSPDVLVLDDNMPAAGGLHVLARLRLERPDIKIVMYVTDAATCAGASALGAAGCVAKSESIETLVSAIRAAGSMAADSQRRV